VRAMENELTKENVRKQILNLRSRLKPEEAASAASAAQIKLLETDIYQKAHFVMLYLDFRLELPTRGILQHVLSVGKIAVLPYIDKNFTIFPYILESESQIVISPLGIPEPDITVCRLADPLSIDLILIPGVAFDLGGNRLGYGKGCYDHFLPKINLSVPRIGMAYDFQIVPSLPANATDQMMDYLLTPLKLYQFRRDHAL
jgi:5-formyltetrahydrofolate cyclo-ligase